MTAIHQGRDRSFWIGTVNLLTQFKDGQFVSYAMAPGNARNYIRAIYEDNDATFWIDTDDNGLYRFRNGQFFHYIIMTDCSATECFRYSKTRVAISGLLATAASIALTGAS